jgi:hypothetical protein
MGVRCQGERAAGTIPSTDVVTMPTLGCEHISSFADFDSSLIYRPGDPSDKLELVKDIIILLAKHLESGARMEEWVGLDLDRFLSSGKVTSNPRVGKQRRAHYGSLFAERDLDLM